MKAKRGGLGLSLLLLAWLLPAAAYGEGEGVLTKAPALLEMVEAEYPAEAQAQGLEGEVVLEIDIGADGSVLDAEVVALAGHGFDEAALEAVRRFRFSPAEIDGVPAAVRIEYRYRFFFRPPPTPEAEPEEESEPTLSVRGVVLERGNRKPIVGASVDAADQTAITGDDGSFELYDLEPGEVEIVVLANGYERFTTTEEIVAGHVVEVKYYAFATLEGAYETVITGRREKKEVSTVAVSVGELTKLPGVSGDSVKVVQNLPGVARAAYGSGRMVVRGGNPNDTRTYIDGQHVPLLFHFGGITSVYASELVEEVQFEPGNFGARYGRAIAGRVELITRPAARERLHLVADADLFDATGLAEGPISEDVSVALAARRSYVDAVILGAQKASPESFDGIGFSIAPRYYDYQAKIGYRLDERNELHFDLYGSSDKLSVVGLDPGGIEGAVSVSTSTGFSRVGITWDHRIGPTTQSRLQVFPGIDQVAFAVGDLFLEVEAYNLSSRAELYHQLSPSLTLAAGLDLVVSRQVLSALTPPQPLPGQMPRPDYRDELIPLDYDVLLTEPALWTEAIWEPVRGLKLVPGLRVDYHSYIESAWVDPRFSTRWQIGEGTTLKGGVGLYHQPPLPQYLAEEVGNPNLLEEGSTQYAVGIEQRIAGPLGVDLQLYYKDLFDLVLPSDRVSMRGGELSFERYNNEGTGRSYGAELLLRYDPDGRFFGWIAYSLSRTERDQQRLRSFGGEASDQPHNLVALGSLELPEIWRGLSFGFRMRYTTGSPRSQVAGGVYDVDTDEYRRLPIPFASGLRFPDFFQLDVRLDKVWTYEESKLAIYLDIQNVTNRANAEGVTYSYDYSQWAYQEGLPIFPSFGIRYEY